MNQVLLTSIFLVALSIQAGAQELSIFPKGEKAANVHHTGDVWLHHVSDADKTFDYNVVLATFAPGAKLDWHVHPGGQQLLMTKGIGYYQERGKPVQIVNVGDVVKCLPGVEHWHGAAPESEFTYLAITGNQPTKWLEKVSEKEYNSIKAPSAASTSAKQELLNLSKKKWQWMADKDVDKLAPLFHDKSKFVHMGGTWGKERELEIIKSGSIWYKNANVHDAVVEVIDDTAILWNRITLQAVVRGEEVSNEFTVTEIYKKQGGDWKLLDLTFSSVRDTHSIER
jgi:4-carboxymuconolactone decarboxylase